MSTLTLNSEALDHAAANAHRVGDLFAAAQSRVLAATPAVTPVAGDDLSDAISRVFPVSEPTSIRPSPMLASSVNRFVAPSLLLRTLT